MKKKGGKNWTKNKWFCRAVLPSSKKNKLHVGGRRVMVVGLELGQLEPGGCVQQSKPWPENRRAGGGGAETSSPLVPPVCFSLLDRPALGPGHLCMSARLGGPCLASQDTSKNPPSPSGEPGLVMPRPCHTDRSFREGEKLRKKSTSVKEST